MTIKSKHNTLQIDIDLIRYGHLISVFVDSVAQFSLRVNVVKLLSFYIFLCRTQKSVPTLEAGHLHTQKAKHTEMRLTCV